MPAAPSIQELAETLFAAIDNAGIGLSIVLQRDGRLERVYSSREACAISGHTAAELAAVSPTQLLAPGERERITEAMRQHGPDQPFPTQFESAIVAKDGAIVPVEVALATVPMGTGMAVVSFLRDLRPRRRIEQALRESEARFRTLAEASPDSITVVAGGRFVYANPAAASVLGFETPDEMMARPLGELLVDPEEGAIMADRLRRVALGEKLPPREYAGRRKDGSIAVMEISTSRVELDGRPGILAFGRDTSERRAWHAELLRSDRLATIGLLAASVAHEINNPLTYTLINLDRLASMVPALIADPEQRLQVEAMLAEAREGAGRVRAIVRDLLGVARHDHAIGPVAVEAAVDTAIKLAGPAIADRARVVRRGPPMPQVLGSDARLSQVFLNLLLNAADAFDRADQGNEIAVELVEDGDHVTVAVADNGAGIAAADLERIFEPLFTTKRLGAGTGLGLSICKSIVTEIGGTIAATSEPGRGTRMTVRLVIARGVAGAAHRVVEPVSRRRARVAVVDDDTALAFAVSRLVRIRHDVETFTVSTVALATLVEGPLFDHVLCDLNMPGLSGVDLYQQLRERRPEYARRFTFITGGVPGPRVEELRAAGDVDLLAKPFDQGSLMAAIERRLPAASP